MADAAAEQGEENVDDELQKMMAELKSKKKKGKKNVKATTTGAEAGGAEEGGKKRKEDREDGENVEEDVAKKPVVATPAAATGPVDDGPYAKMGERSYVELLGMLYDKLRLNNPDLVTPTKKILPPPQVTKVGTSKSNWMNFPDICKIMKREPEHVFRFFLAELGTTGSIDGNGRFMIKGKYDQKTIESLLRKYIAGYVSCQSCRGVATNLVKDSITRMSFMQCTSCGASRTVTAIQKGYVATGKGERFKARNAE